MISQISQAGGLAISIRQGEVRPAASRFSRDASSCKRDSDLAAGSVMCPHLGQAPSRSAFDFFFFKTSQL